MTSDNPYHIILYQASPELFFQPCLFTSYSPFSTSCFQAVYPVRRFCIIRIINSKGKRHTAEGEPMKVKIEIDPALAEDEVIIRCRRMEEHILKLQQDIAKAEPEKNCISLQDAGTSYFVPLDEILFFETEGKHIQAHTAFRLYLTEHKLYELEESLPGSFMRISKSTIVNLDHIYSITRNLAASSAVAFYGTPKKVYVSRSYYKALIERLGERRRKL